MAQGLRASLADAGVAVAGADDVLLAARLNARELEFFAENRSELLQRQLHFKDMAARFASCPVAVARLRRSQGRTRIAVALAGAGGALLSVAKLRNVDLRQRNADEIFAFLADHLAAADVLAEVALNLAADNLFESLMIAL